VPEQRLVINIAGCFIPTDNFANLPDQLDRRVLWIGQGRPKPLLFEQVRRSIPQFGSFDMKHRVTIPLFEPEGPDI
jgi:hypothetical protein